MPTRIRMLGVVLMVVWGLSVPTVGYGQDASLIYACVDQQGRLTIIVPGGSCGARETLLTWPATPAEPATFYQRVSASQPVPRDLFVSAVALCDDPTDVATGGGYLTDRLDVHEYGYAVLTSTSCRASGMCGGPEGEDGWIAVAQSNVTAAPFPTLTAYVICAKP